MLKKTERLTKSEFNEYFKAGRRFHSPALTLIYHPSSSFHGAAVVGKKVFKQAVDRNRLRRRLYNLIYQAHRTGQIKGINIIIAKPAAKALSFKELKENVAKLLEQVDRGKQKS